MIANLKKMGASDLHLEPGLAPTARVQGELKPLAKDPVAASQTRAVAKDILNKEQWKGFLERLSCDLSLIISGVRCRVHIMKTHRGVGLAIRLLSSFQPNLERLNLHPDLAKLVDRRNGLVVITGPTGSGKSSTLAALLHEISVTKCLHIVTVESPIEYPILPRRSFVRQREVGPDTPSFDRALLDALREDPDVIMVGEVRERETIKLTLNAAETGQLVLTTLHSSNPAEAVQRIVASFPPEIQGSVCHQLADCLVGVVAQRLHFNESYMIRVPVCEILVATNPVKNLIRQGQFYKLASALETGYGEGNWTFRRYQQWLDGRTDFYVPSDADSLDVVPEVRDELAETPSALEDEKPELSKGPPPLPAGPDDSKEAVSEDVIVIEEPAEESLSDILKKLDGPEGDKG